ncbi:hypothetical protein [Oceanobacillus sp. AG]|uniref:hypothetical protein n=1 Tax=Oceanobacillus sp. AG TaxID=2681969 RepID=UPI0018DD1A87|nr:hypothetical protein [Oceanobacillus sp. AG]
MLYPADINPKVKISDVKIISRKSSQTASYLGVSIFSNGFLFNTLKNIFIITNDIDKIDIIEAIITSKDGSLINKINEFSNNVITLVSLNNISIITLRIVSFAVLWPNYCHKDDPSLSEENIRPNSNTLFSLNLVCVILPLAAHTRLSNLEVIWRQEPNQAAQAKVKII